MNKKIKQLREARGLSQRDLGRMVGVNASAVNRWESGEKKPELVNLVRLADLFEVTLDYLMGRTENKNGA